MVKINLASPLPRFEGSLEFSPLPDGRNMRIDRSDYRFFDRRGRRWEIRAGRDTDGASIPSMLWPFIGGPFEGEHRIPAIFHDDAYGRAKTCTAWEALKSEERAAADRMLYEAMLCAGVDFWRAQIIYTAVRRFGWIAWKHEEHKTGD